MSMRVLLSVSVLGMALLATMDDAQAGSVVFRKPPPEGVVEITDYPGWAFGTSIVELKDGSLLANTGRVSTDGGLTWEARKLNAEQGASGIIRLQSGGLAIFGKKGDNWCFSSSADEGKTWSKPSVICPTWAGGPEQMIQLSTGRLLVCMARDGGSSAEAIGGKLVSVHPELDYYEKTARGLWRGQIIEVEGHMHTPEMANCVVYRSDDEGQTWEKHPGALVGWFDFEGIVNGYCGTISCCEPTIAETKDGHVLLFMRAPVGRVLQSFSTDGGEHWSAVRPSELAGSESPATLARIPQTGDLLVVWNQVSREEIRRGYRRGRLSAAISKDGGHSWENFKTLELSEGLADIDRIPPEYPIQMVRARDWVGPLPDGWAYFHYPYVAVIGDKVFIWYFRGSPLLGIAERNLSKHEYVMRIYPLDWFYQ